MPRHQRLTAPGVLLCLAALGPAPCRAAELPEILHRGTVALESDWAADLSYSYVLKEERTRGGKPAVRTSQMVMIEGSDYYLPSAAERESSEIDKLRAEVQRRQTESAEARRQRIERFTRAREETGAMLLQVPKAFAFELLREETMDGHPSYVLSATPLKRSTAGLSRAAKVLSGMNCTMWIDAESFHAVRGECNVVSPVPVFGILARVLPGTHIELRMQPVTDSTWLPREFSMVLTVSKFFLFRSTQETRYTYSDYQPNENALRDLLAGGNRSRVTSGVLQRYQRIF
ncbi:MAG TPA: hypothetical protein VG273_19635 [Bryobacteraceae bacterium]|jgi:hypothetical protein|nr:hypothetical protein [Bryobacteraceae bacterium]